MSRVTASIMMQRMEKTRQMPKHQPTRDVAVSSGCLVKGDSDKSPDTGSLNKVLLQNLHPCRVVLETLQLEGTALSIGISFRDQPSPGKRRRKLRMRNLADMMTETSNDEEADPDYSVLDEVLDSGNTARSRRSKVKKSQQMSRVSGKENRWVPGCARTIPFSHHIEDLTLTDEQCLPGRMELRSAVIETSPESMPKIIELCSAAIQTSPQNTVIVKKDPTIHQSVTSVKQVCIDSGNRSHVDTVSNINTNVEKDVNFKKIEKKGDKRITCGLCGWHVQNIRKHMLHKHSEKKFNCNECGKAFKIRKTLRRHIRLCQGQIHKESQTLSKDSSKVSSKSSNTALDDSVLCEFCGKHYPKHRIMYHKRSVHMDKKYTCKICSTSYGMNKTFLRHMRECHDARGNVQCNQCDKFFPRYTLKDHILFKHTERKYKCQICGEKAFVKQDMLDRHVKVCEKRAQRKKNEKAYMCALCDNSFDSRETLLDHGNSTGHKENLKRLKVKIGGERVFKDKILNHKRRAHAIESNIMCEACGKVFHDKQNLARHKFLCGKNKREFSCPHCSFISKSLTNSCLKLHIKTKHSKINIMKKLHSCTLCSWTSVSISKYTLLTHMRSHSGEMPYKCKTCYKSFSSSGCLSQHKKIHTDERFTCGVEGCGKTFTQKCSLKCHMVTHDNIRPYQCEWCEHSFKQSYQLAKHVEKVHTKHLKDFLNKDIRRAKRK